MEALVRYLFEKTGHEIGIGALTASSDGAGSQIHLSLNEQDINKLAGSEARLLRSIRSILSAAAASKNMRVSLEISEI